MKQKQLVIRMLLWAAALQIPSFPVLGAGGDTWIKKADMPTPRAGLSTCVLDGKIYAFGGFPDSNSLGMKTAEAYDPVTDTWTKRADMPTGRFWTAAAAVNGKIYVIGGGTVMRGPVLKTVEEYDPVANTWTRKSDMPTARLGAGSAVVEGKIYILGGTKFVAPPISTVEVYDPFTDTWEQKASMPTQRAMLCANEVEGKIYAIGASHPGGPWLPTVEMYDPVTDRWTRKSNMPTARGTSAGATINGKIYIMGGRNCCSSFATVEEYDPRADTWVKRADMRLTPTATSQRRWTLSASEVNGRIYAIGGAYDLDEPHSGRSLVLEYTPPPLQPVIVPKTIKMSGKNAFRLEWFSQSNSIDRLQTRDWLLEGAWRELEQIPGTGDVLSRDLPVAGPSGFYRIHRELR